jgi:hypothetical protein
MTESAKRPLGKFSLGIRNSTLSRCIGAWINEGLSEAQIWKKASELNAQNFYPPLPPSVLSRLIASILRLVKQKG